MTAVATLQPRGIAVTALSPGSLSTEFAKVASAGARPEVLHGKPVGLAARKAARQAAAGYLWDRIALEQEAFYREVLEVHAGHNTTVKRIS